MQEPEQRRHAHHAGVERHQHPPGRPAQLAHPARVGHERQVDAVPADRAEPDEREGRPQDPAARARRDDGQAERAAARGQAERGGAAGEPAVRRDAPRDPADRAGGEADGQRRARLLGREALAVDEVDGQVAHERQLHAGHDEPEQRGRRRPRHRQRPARVVPAPASRPCSSSQPARRCDPSHSAPAVVISSVVSGSRSATRQLVAPATEGRIAPAASPPSVTPVCLTLMMRPR